MNKILSKYEISGSIGIFTLYGELNERHENELTLLLMKALHGIERAILNLKEVTRISSPCLQLLNKAYHTSVRLRNPLIFTEVPKDYISDLFNYTHCKKVIDPLDNEHIKERKATNSYQGVSMGVRKLAEAVMLQSIEDLWYPEHSRESKDFFSGDAFSLCSEIAGLDSTDISRLIHFLKENAHDRFCTS